MAFWRGVRWNLALVFIVLACSVSVLSQQTKPRARDLGIPFDGTPGSLNAITDVTGVEVGFTTLISGEGKLTVGKGPVRTPVSRQFFRAASRIRTIRYLPAGIRLTATAR